MTPFVVRSVSSLKGQINLSGDKSISHRAIILSSLSSGLTRINNFPSNKDCLETLGAFAKLGIKFKKEKKDTLLIIGKGLFGLRKPK
ncbi:MAG: 3-phosphoshikimate 1-carboxyvinyltransferase, partial [Candidatus Omnitrophica bacterium]|nr:3-phosphoshikimate 1-carboxyvinyltransferase [Candidatus Omnitrophota bacterium]